jgi:hypothetical protein
MVSPSITSTTTVDPLGTVPAEVGGVTASLPASVAESDVQATSTRLPLMKSAMTALGTWIFASQAATIAAMGLLLGLTR